MLKLFFILFYFKHNLLANIDKFFFLKKKKKVEFQNESKYGFKN